MTYSLGYCTSGDSHYSHYSITRHLHHQSLFVYYLAFETTVQALSTPWADSTVASSAKVKPQATDHFSRPPRIPQVN